ncbi:hypothetical protein KCG51_00040 [Neisseria subflava]|uniref:hypothetical protein n=1 Tax=Neisseria subflava TaxID=28449 RepID=UPI0020B881F9|nr:hypothetical protein [Neisseria subflava]UTG77263.1 hypothetical protein KCG51_00040 [Neisseria subflava]
MLFGFSRFFLGQFALGTLFCLAVSWSAAFLSLAALSAVSFPLGFFCAFFSNSAFFSASFFLVASFSASAFAAFSLASRSALSAAVLSALSLASRSALSAVAFSAFFSFAFRPYRQRLSLLFLWLHVLLVQLSPELLFPLELFFGSLAAFSAAS